MNAENTSNLPYETNLSEKDGSNNKNVQKLFKINNKIDQIIKSVSKNTEIANEYYWRKSVSSDDEQTKFEFIALENKLELISKKFGTCNAEILDQKKQIKDMKEYVKITEKKYNNISNEFADLHSTMASTIDENSNLQQQLRTLESVVDDIAEEKQLLESEIEYCQFFFQENYKDSFQEIESDLNDFKKNVFDKIKEDSSAHEYNLLREELEAQKASFNSRINVIRFVSSVYGNGLSFPQSRIYTSKHLQNYNKLIKSTKE